MTAAQLIPGTLDRHIPDLLAAHHVIALVPAPGYPAWSAMNAWRVARSAASSGRRTALVDCVVDEPVLHTVAGAPNDEGLVDAFLYGASFSRIAQPQPEANLFFIPAGTFAPDPTTVLTSPRWRRLAAGFRHEGALLLLFVPEERLESLSADLDGMIVLAPQGMDLAVAEAPGVAQAMGRGLVMLAAVGDAPQPDRDSGTNLVAAPADVSASPDPGAAKAGGPAADAHAAPRPPAIRRRRASAPMSLLVPPPRTVPWALYAVLFVLSLGATGYLYREELLALAGRAPAPEPAPPPFVHRAPPPHPVDSLRFVVQVAAWPTFRQALRAADNIAGHGAVAFVTPVRLGRRRDWYRVHVGPLATRAAADSALAALLAARLAPRGAAVVDAPFSVALTGALTRDSADAERARWRTASITTFALGQADRTYRLFAGAFDDSTQAALLRRLLTSAGGTGELVPRVGYVP